MVQQNILLDSDIRDWVVLPLLAIMVFAGLLRVHIGNLLKGSPKNMTRIQQRVQSLGKFAASLKSGSVHFLSSSKFELRKIAYPALLQDQAEWCEIAIEEDERAAAERADNDDDMPNPLAAMEGMQGNMAFMMQNMVMMQAIQHFFSGFILLKIPFPLTVGFKQMFQKGVALDSLDTSYVSSVSWYFLVMFGLRGFFRLVIGTPSQEVQETQMLLGKFGKKPASGGGGPGSGDEEQVKLLTTEADNLEMMLPKHFKSQLDTVEKRLLKNKYPKKKAVLGQDDFLLMKGPSSSSSSTTTKTTSAKANNNNKKKVK